MENKLDVEQSSYRNLDTMAWGAFFVWWGITSLVVSLPKGAGAMGIGLIFLGLNAARYMKGFPVSGFTTILGILALVWGGLDLAGVLLSLPFQMPTFAIIVIVLGVSLVAGQLVGRKNL
jgi:intracellular septation protein A